MPSNIYELTLLFPTSLSSEVLDQSVQKVGEIIAGQGGKVEKKDDWGKKRMAYSIAKQREAHYFYFEFSLESTALAEVQRQIKLLEQPLRFMIIKQEKKKTTPAPARRREKKKTTAEKKSSVKAEEPVAAAAASEEKAED